MNIISGFEVRYYDNHQHYIQCTKGNSSPKILHNPRSFDNKLISGKLKQTINEIWTFEFAIPYNHQYYSDLKFITGLVEVVNLKDGEREFLGRILIQTGEMSGSGNFSRSFICEDLLGYLHDTAQEFKKYKNDGPRQFLNAIIEYHNINTENHKRFILRDVTVDSGSDVPFRYTAYDSTFDTIKTYALDRMGGYIVLDINNSGMYIDWLKEVGEFIDSPIKLGKNIKSSTRELNPEGLITRLVPVGADKDNSTGREEETGQYVTRERVTIESVNGGVRYLEDSELVREFGVIQKSVDWTEISDPAILKSRGKQYLDNQKLAIASWTVETVELYLIDSRFKKYKVGNTHPIDNPPIAGVEKLQIIEKEIDIMNPQVVRLKVGSSGQTLSMYQLQQQEAKKSMQRQAENEASARRKAEAQLEANQKELEKVQNQIKGQIESIDRENNKSILENNLKQYQALLADERVTLESLNAEKTRLEGLDDNQTELINFVELQISISETKISNYIIIIDEINQKLSELTESQG